MSLPPSPVSPSAMDRKCNPVFSSLTTQELTERYVLGNYGRFPIACESGEGVWITDESGQRYLDFAAGVAVCALGHCPEVMVKALSDQGSRLIHCSNLYQIRKQAELAGFLVEKVMKRPGKVFFCNSGTEANEGLIKVARKRSWTKFGPEAGKSTIVTCLHSFHGRTLGGMAATGQDKIKKGFDPMAPGFIHVPYNDPAALRAAVDQHTAAILFEAIQGEGGVHVASPEFFAEAARLRDEFDLLIMYDEIQCGMGRTGDWCGWRGISGGSAPVEPDAVSWAKGIGGGFPMGAFWTADEHASVMGPGSHGSTFGGTPLACAVSLAVLNEIEHSGILANVRRQETRIREAVAQWKSPLIQELRGAGLLLGFALDPAQMAKVEGFTESGQTPSIYFVNALRNQVHLLTVPAGEQVVRWLPPLNVTDDEVDNALDRFHTLLSTLFPR